MKIPARIIAPVILAVVLAAALMAFLWWQLTQATLSIKQGVIEQVELTDGTETSLSLEPIDPRDEALLHLRQGDLFALRGEWKLAQEEYEESVKLDGGLPALRKLVQAQLQRRDLSGAKSTIRKLKSAGARPEHVMLIEAVISLRTGELVKARSTLDEADDSPQKHYGLALLAIIEGNHELAQEHLVQVANGWEPVLRSYARTLQEAYEEFALFPESNNVHLVTLLSRALAQVQECELALPLLVQITQLENDYRDAWIVQGFCELTTERFEQALASLEHAYGIDPQKPEIQYFLGRTYASLEDHTNAITFFEYAIANGFKPESEVRERIAVEALKDGKGTIALEQFRAMIEVEEPTLVAFEGFIETAIAIESLEEAYLKAQKAVELFPNEAQAHHLLGWAAMEQERYEEARIALNTAIELDPFLIAAKQRLEQLE